MTIEEAHLFLKTTDEEDLADVYELALFEIRQFLLSKPVLLKPFKGKQTRLKKLREAFLVLGGTEQKQITKSEINFRTSEIILEHFSNYHAAKNELKKQLMQVTDSNSLEVLLETFIHLERAFIAPFSAYVDWTDEVILVSREADIMLVLSLLREQAVLGYETIPQLHRNRNKLPIELARELKRLSLHQNYLYDE